jgi:hypothetical protein
MGDSEIVQVDFLQDIQQNMTKFQTLMEKLGSRVEQLESTTAAHSQACICTNSANQQPSTSTTSDPLNGKSIQHPEIVRIDAKVNALDSRVESLRNDLKTLASSINELLEQTQVETPKIARGTPISVNVRSPVPVSISGELTASKLLNQRKPLTGSAAGTVKPLVRPPPPMLMRAPGPPTSASMAPIKKTDLQQQQKSPAPAAVTKVLTNYDNGSDEDENDDEYEGEEENDGGLNAEEEQDDSFMQIQPEVIMYGGDDDDDGGADYPQDDDVENADFGDFEEDEFDDSLNYGLEFGKMEGGGADEGIILVLLISLNQMKKY